MSILRLMGVVVLAVSLTCCTSGCAKLRKKSDGGAGQLAALKGEDIPLSDDLSSYTFVDPAEYDAVPEAKTVFKDIHFDYDSSEIKEEAKIVLKEIASLMDKYGQLKVLVEGHCDERGSKEYNLALGEQRALNVRKYLVTLGVSSDRLATVSYGEEKPLVSGNDESAWAQNRRAHFLIATTN